MWGLKTFYYSLINKQGSRAQEEQVDTTNVVVLNFNSMEDDDCEACKL